MGVDYNGDIQFWGGPVESQSMALDLLSPPNHFASSLLDELGGRAWLIRDPDGGGHLVSSPLLRSVSDLLMREGCDHEAIFLATGRGSGTLFAAVIHPTRRGQAQGGVRHCAYDSGEDLLCDGLRLARTMTRKNALAGLWWGGGKGLIARVPGDRADDADFRRCLYQEYGAFVTSLRGIYVAGEDAGTRPADMAEIFRATRFATCIPPERGGSGNPSRMTAEGVVAAMEAGLLFLEQNGLHGKKVVLQGTGNVGSAMIRLLLDRGVRQIVASEVCADRREALLDRWSGAPVEIRQVREDDPSILWEPCDVLSPCAMGGVLGSKTIPSVQARMICGSANDPLENELRDAAALAQLAILYVPDFVANRMGIVSCGNEQYGFIENDPLVHRHLDREWPGGIHQTVLRICEESRREAITPLEATLRLADAQAQQTHPIWGHRASRIIESVIESSWASAG